MEILYMILGIPLFVMFCAAFYALTAAGVFAFERVFYFIFPNKDK